MNEQPPIQGQTPLSADEEAFLRAFTRALLTVPRAFDADLLRGQGMSMTEYVTLMHLSEAPGRWLRMSDLATGTSMSLSGMTRIVQRLEAQGWVRRQRSVEDRRGWQAVLTDAGLQRLQKAWPTHLASVRSHVLDHTDGLDLAAVTAAMQRFAEGVEYPSAECEG
ncbi:MarR family winged helix-turn-helix transcriptional regulator [Streptomyces sp. NPDC091217]|uniref:MarR family winged helix-turn-helix transcriptional regulator n=1 Tax=Streptomyces sp. NPDC091217 TaxID=3365975 RepID=UPI003809178A